MLTSRVWLDAGLDTLANGGIDAVRIDKLAAQLGVSKGSFYHHFSGINGYCRDLLAHFAAECTTRYIDAVEAEPDTPAEHRLRRLIDLVLEDDGGQPALEAAMRAWAGQDEVAAAALKRVDAVRLEYTSALCTEIVGDSERGSDLARMLYLLLIGAQHVIPPSTEQELRRLYTLVTDRMIAP